MPERARSLLVILAAAVLLAGCGGGGPRNAEGFVAGEPSVTLVPPDQRVKAPEVSGRALGGDTTIDTASYVGKVVVLNVWGSWCGPCRAEAPDLQAASEQTAGVAQFVGLNTRDLDPAQASAFVRAFEIGYPSIYDPQGRALIQLAGDLPPSGIPSTLVIDRQGRVAARVVGPISKGTLVDLIDDVAGGR